MRCGFLEEDESKWQRGQEGQVCWVCVCIYMWVCAWVLERERERDTDIIHSFLLKWKLNQKNQPYPGEQGVETVHFLPFCDVSVILGHSLQRELFHEVDLVGLLQVRVLQTQWKKCFRIKAARLGTSIVDCHKKCYKRLASFLWWRNVSDWTNVPLLGSPGKVMIFSQFLMKIFKHKI